MEKVTSIRDASRISARTQKVEKELFARCSISEDHLGSKDLNGGVAHLGERLNGIQEVVGSIPIVSTTGKSRDRLNGFKYRKDLDRSSVEICSLKTE